MKNSQFTLVAMVIFITTVRLSRFWFWGQVWDKSVECSEIYYSIWRSSHSLLFTLLKITNKCLQRWSLYWKTGIIIHPSECPLCYVAESNITERVCKEIKIK
jgi:hypothetical protein